MIPVFKLRSAGFDIGVLSDGNCSAARVCALISEPANWRGRGGRPRALEDVLRFFLRDLGIAKPSALLQGIFNEIKSKNRVHKLETLTAPCVRDPETIECRL